MTLKTALLWTVCGLIGANAQFYEDIFWIVSHGQLTATRLDPVMSPGGVSGHVHAIVGGSNFGPVYDYDTSLESQCTTANIAVDHSNYWMPQLYNKHANGTFSVAGLSYVQTYYQLRREENEPVYEFPPGFRMLAGDQDRRTIDLDDPAQDAVRYVCLGGTTPEGHVFPPEQCSHGMRAQIYFPHCWDGINSWLEGSKHVSYGEGRFDGGGKCPPTHPKRIMGLFYEFIFHDHEQYRAGGRVWSNGDDVGYSLHADFTNGWPVGFFSEIFSYGRECSVGFGVDKCPALAPHVVKDQKCAYTGIKVDEDIGDQGAIAKLPGNNPPLANYEESAGFNSGSPSPTQIASVPATSIIMTTVKGDTPRSAPPDAIPQSGQTSAAGQSAGGVGSSAAPTAPASASAPTSSAAASSAPAGSSQLPSLPGGGGVLVGGPAISDSASASASNAPTDPADPASSGGPIAPSGATSSALPVGTTLPDAGSPSESVSPSPGRPSRGPKSCPKGGRRGSHNSVDA